MLKLINVALPLLFISLIVSCKKKDEIKSSSPDLGHLKTIYLQSNKKIAITNQIDYKQENLNEIKQTVIYYNDESTKEEYNYSYNWFSENENTKVVFSSSNTDFNNVTYYLNDKNLLDSSIRKAYVPGSLDGRLKQIYTYSMDKLTSIISILYAPGVSSDTTYYFYKQNENGNMIEKSYVSRTYDGSIMSEKEIKMEFEYDNKSNPFKHFVGIEYFFHFYTDIIYFNNNNIISVSIYEDGTLKHFNSNFNYEYNNRLSPTKIQIVDNGYDYDLLYN